MRAAHEAEKESKCIEPPGITTLNGGDSWGFFFELFRHQRWIK